MLQPSPPRQSMNDRLIEKSKNLVVRPSIYMRTGNCCRYGLDRLNIDETEVEFVSKSSSFRNSAAVHHAVLVILL
jgi:hypothetical protein